MNDTQSPTGGKDLSDAALFGLIEEIRLAKCPKSPDTVSLLNAVSLKIRERRKVFPAEKRKIEAIYSYMCR